jgi:predicted AlkP superfamily phosphohydrolase/phosphomutase
MPVKTERILIVLIIVVLVAGLFVLVPKISRRQEAPAPVPVAGDVAPGSVSLLIVGIEGLERSIVERLVSEGRMPNLSRLMTEGAVGGFPTLGKSVDGRISWTSLVTGVTPENQGIGGYHESKRGDMVKTPLTPEFRTVDTIWTLLSNAGTPVAVMGWPGTWPVEEVNGAMVGGYTQYHLDRSHEETRERACYPLHLASEFDPLIIDMESITRRDLSRFVDLESELGLEALSGQNYTSLQSAVGWDRSMVNAALYAIGELGIANVLIYLNGVDEVSQRFWHYMDPEVMRNLPVDGPDREHLDELGDALGETIDRYYEFVDELVGELSASVGENGTVAVIAAHGYGGVEFDSAGRPKIGYEMHSERGFWILSGPRVVAGARVEEAALFDVAPTIMQAASIPIPDATEGTPRREMLKR